MGSSKNPNLDKGKRAELAVAAAFVAGGFPAARRAVVTGARVGEVEIADPGDLAGVPRTVVSVKDCTVERLPRWRDELEAMRAGAGATYAVLVVKRHGNGYGGNAGTWWAHISLGELDDLLGNDGHHPAVDRSAFVRLELAALLPLLRVALEDDLAAEAAA